MDYFEKKTVENRIAYVDALRGIATLAVVILHVSAGYWGTEAVPSAPWLTATFYDGMTRWCVPVFVMISGTLLLSTKKETKIGFRIRKILIPLFIWSAVYAVVDCFRGSDWISSFESFLTGHYHLWYLYMLIGLYLILPLLKKITENEKYEIYFLVLSLVFNFILPQTMGLLGFLAPGAWNLLEVVTGKMSLQFVLGYSGYFVLGHWMHHRFFSKKHNLCIYLAGSLGFILTVVLTFAASVSTSYPEKLFFSYFSCNVLLASMAVFLAFRKIRYSSRFAEWMRKFSNYSFGVFLVHPLILETLSGLIPEGHLILTIPVTSLIVYLLSLAITVALKSIPWFGGVGI